MIKYPVRAEKNPDATYACLVDASDRVIAGGMEPGDASTLANVFNKAVALFYAYADESSRGQGEALRQIVIAVGNTLPRTATEKVETAPLKRPRRKSRKDELAEELRDSDVTAKATGRTDIVYGPHDSLPRGEHVARIKKDLLNSKD